MTDFVIPIAFPDYQIAVSIPPVNVDYTVPGTSMRIRYRRKGGKEYISNLGHAGVLYFNHKGSSRYYEYGRYDAAALGEVRKRRISDLTMSGGQPTKTSFTNVLRQISNVAGHKTRIEAAYITLPNGRFALMDAYCQRRMKQNSDSSRAPYALTTNSCMHFALWCVEAGGAKTPWIWDPRPINMAQEFQGMYPPVRYRNGRLTVDGVEGF